MIYKQYNIEGQKRKASGQYKPYDIYSIIYKRLLQLYFLANDFILYTAYHQRMIYIIYYNKCMYDKMPLKALNVDS